LSSVPNITSALTGAVNRDVGALITNTSRYGTKLATDWAKGSGLGDLTNLPNLNLGTVAGNLNKLVPTSSSGLSTEIQNLNVLGKASQFATQFANPAASIDALATKVQGQALATAGQLQGQALAAAGQLQGQALAAAGQLQGQANAALGQLQAQLGNLGGGLVSAKQIAAGFSNTVNRSTVDAAFTRVLGSAKIPTPQFSIPIPGSASLNASADIAAAQKFLAGLRSQAGELVGGAQAQAGKLLATAQATQTQAGQLLASAQAQGTQLVGSVQTQATQLAGQATQIVG
jgi:hypothetical protein